jgi:hypothetical protein
MSDVPASRAPASRPPDPRPLTGEPLAPDLLNTRWTRDGTVRDLLREADGPAW